MILDPLVVVSMLVVVSFVWEHRCFIAGGMQKKMAALVRVPAVERCDFDDAVLVRFFINEGVDLLADETAAFCM